jgi:hypothetical protein
MLSPFRGSLSLSLTSRLETLDSTVPFLFVPAPASGAGSRPATVSEDRPVLSSPLVDPIFHGPPQLAQLTVLHCRPQELIQIFY